MFKTLLNALQRNNTRLRLTEGVLLVAIVLVFILVSVIQREPSHQRDWELISEKTPDATIRSNTVTLHNVRNWNHTKTETVSKDWIDEVTINPKDIVRVWFGYSGFSKIKALGHTFLSFELENGEGYTLSVEARREKGEEYSAVKGLFNTYDLLYGWGTERDYVGVRVHLLEQPIEMYPLELTPEEAAAVFVAVAEETHRVSENPRFYNTITSNCTNELAHAINQKYPGKMHYSLAHNLPGLFIGYLQRIGLLAEQKRVVIPGNNAVLLNAASKSSKDFSVALRTILEKS